MTEKEKQERYTRAISLIEKTNAETQPIEESLNPSDWHPFNLFKTLWAIWKGEKDWRGKLLGLYRNPPQTRKKHGC